MTDTRPITVEGMDKLRQELDWLYREERPRLLIEIAEAAAQGDRSENAEYIYGKKRLREIDQRLRILTDKISNSAVVSGTRRVSDKIVFGARIRLKRNDGNELILQIVGVDEIDPLEGKISMESPMGKTLMGHSAQGEINVPTPKGLIPYQIMEVDYP